MLAVLLLALSPCYFPMPAWLLLMTLPSGTYETWRHQGETLSGAWACTGTIHSRSYRTDQWSSWQTRCCKVQQWSYKAKEFARHYFNNLLHSCCLPPVILCAWQLPNIHVDDYSEEHQELMLVNGKRCWQLSDENGRSSCTQCHWLESSGTCPGNIYRVSGGSLALDDWSPREEGDWCLPFFQICCEISFLGFLWGGASTTSSSASSLSSSGIS